MKGQYCRRFYYSESLWRFFRFLKNTDLIIFFQKTIYKMCIFKTTIQRSLTVAFFQEKRLLKWFRRQHLQEGKMLKWLWYCYLKKCWKKMSELTWMVKLQGRKRKSGCEYMPYSFPDPWVQVMKSKQYEISTGLGSSKVM